LSLGFFDAGLKPVLSVASGDTVTIDSVSGGPDVLPDGARFDILSEHLAIHEALEPRLGAHILTRPIAVEGAEPGDVLEIQILSIDPRQNWGYTRIRPLSGTPVGRGRLALVVGRYPGAARKSAGSTSDAGACSPAAFR
jgi:acetamidase/formamidase